MIREQGFTNPAQQAVLVFNRRSRDLLSAGVTGLGQARLWSHTVAPFTPAPVQIPASFFVKIIRTPFGVLIILAEKQGFEPWRPFADPTPLAGEPLRPLGYFSIYVAEREGFEPPVPCDITGFQDRRLKPLGHLSTPSDPLGTTLLLCNKRIISKAILVVNIIFIPAII